MFCALIVAAGKSSRMGPDTDKLFLPVAGQPLIAHTWRIFEACDAIDEVVLVVREATQNRFDDLAQRFRFRKPFRLAVGGRERQESVWNGLQAIPPECDIVAIHDGARPCASPTLVRATIAAAREGGAAVAAQRLTDTIKESDGGEWIARTVDRARLWSAQTPQTFQIDIIRRALTLVRAKGLQVTDDAAACECIGQRVKLIESLAPNPKVTTPADLPCVELLLGRR